MSRPKPPVPGWVRITVCVIPIVAVPGMLVAAVLGAPLSIGVTSAVAIVAVASARLAFLAKPIDEPDPPAKR